MAEYDSSIALALKLIAKKGRTAILRRNADVVPDADKPWRATSPATSTDFSIKVVNVPISADRPEGVHRTRDDRMLLVSTEGVTDDILYTDVIVDDGQSWSIQTLSKIKPGDQVIMYELLIRKWPPRSNS